MSNDIKYYLKGSYKGIGMFYIVLVGIHLFFALIGDFARSNGMMAVTVIATFVFGLNSYKENFFHFMAMCRTRKNLFKGYVASAAIIAPAMAVINVLISLLANLSPTIEFGLGFNESETGITFALFLSMVCAHFMAMCLGYMVTVAFYRMDKTMKWLVSALVIAGVFVVWPYLDYTFFGGALTEAFVRFMSATFFSTNGYIASLSAIIAAAVGLGFSYLGVRSATIK